MVILFDVGGPIMADDTIFFIMAGSQSNFWILDHLYQDLCSSSIKSEFSSLDWIQQLILPLE